MLYYVRKVEWVFILIAPDTMKVGETMTYSENKKRYNAEYAKTNIKRLPFDVQLSNYAEIQAAAAAAGETVNGYIKRAVDLRMESEQTT